MLEGIGLRPISYTTRDYSIGWSSSRFYPLKRCEMLYYFEKMPIDWLSFPRKIREEIKDLREHSALRIETGLAVHGAIATYYRYYQADQEMSGEVLIRTGLDAFSDAVATKKIYERRALPPDDFDQRVREESEKVQSLLEVFKQLPERPIIAEAIRARPDSVFLDHGEETRTYGEFRAGNLKGYGSPDLVYLDGDDTYNVISWKTGNHEADDFRLQLAAQLLFCQHSLKLPPDKLKGKVINLNHIDEEPIELDGDPVVIEQCVERMKRDLEEVKVLYADNSCKIPKKKELFNGASSPLACGSCKYQHYCQVANHLQYTVR